MGIDRKTVGRYVAAIQAAGIGDATEVNEALLGSLARAVQERRTVAPAGSPREVPSVRLVRSRWARRQHPRAWGLVNGSPAVFLDGGSEISQVPGESLSTCPAV